MLLNFTGVHEIIIYNGYSKRINLNNKRKSNKTGNNNLMKHLKLIKKRSVSIILMKCDFIQLGLQSFRKRIKSMLCGILRKFKKRNAWEKYKIQHLNTYI